MTIVMLPIPPPMPGGIIGGGLEETGGVVTHAGAETIVVSPPGTSWRGGIVGAHGVAAGGVVVPAVERPASSPITNCVSVGGMRSSGALIGWLAELASRFNFAKTSS